MALTIGRWFGLGAILCGLTFVPAPAAEGADLPTRSVSNCEGESAPVIGLDSPRENLVYEGVLVHILLDGDCGGESVPFTLGIDGIGYEVQNDRLRPGPQDPGCPQPCWPQQGVGVPLGEYRHTVKLSPGEHLLEVTAGYQGTNLPYFEPIKVRFFVEGSALPFTGTNVLRFSGLAMVLIVGGVMLLRRSSRPEV